MFDKEIFLDLAKRQNFTDVRDKLLGYYSATTVKAYSGLLEGSVTDFLSAKQLMMFLSQIQPELFDQLRREASEYILGELANYCSSDTNFTLYSELSYLCYLLHKQEGVTDAEIEAVVGYDDFKDLCKGPFPRIAAQLEKSYTLRAIRNAVKRWVKEEQVLIEETRGRPVIIGLTDAYVIKIYSSPSQGQWFLTPVLGYQKILTFPISKNDLGQEPDEKFVAAMDSLFGSAEEFIKLVRDQLFFPDPEQKIMYRIINLIGDGQVTDEARSFLGQVFEGHSCGSLRNSIHAIQRGDPIVFCEGESPLSNLSRESQYMLRELVRESRSVPTFVSCNMNYSEELAKMDQNRTKIYDFHVGRLDEQYANFQYKGDVKTNFAKLLFKSIEITHF